MKHYALCENHLFSKAYSKGKRAVTSALALYVLPDYAAKRLAKSHPDKRIMNRIGLTATKTIGGAVVRSRARRIMREALWAIERENNLKSGFLIVIVARRASVTMKSTEIKEHLDTLFKRLSMYESTV